MASLTERLAFRTARTLGSPGLFAWSCIFVGAWLALGEPLRFSTAWEFIANQPLTIGSWMASIITLYVANRVDERTEELRLQAAHQEEIDRERFKRMEAQNLAMLLWLREILRDTDPWDHPPTRRSPS